MKKLYITLFAIIQLSFCFGQNDSIISTDEEGINTKTSSFGGKLRIEPSINSDIIYEFSGGEDIIVFKEYKKPYFKVKFQEMIGYLSSASIVLNEELRQVINREKEFISTPSKTNSYNPENKSTYKKYHTGPRGGCYYINSKGKKVYVDKSFCK